MAQDFAAAFGVGEDDKHISTVDADGVALAAIQGLYKVVQEKDAKISAQQQQIDDLNTRLTALEKLAGATSPAAAGFANPWFVLAAVLGGVMLLERRRGRKQT
jgi:hypothetical protein